MNPSPYTTTLLTEIKALGGLSGKRALDVGCGNGYLAEQLQLQGAHVLGIDVRDEAILSAQARGVTAVKMDFRDVLQHLGTSFDVVVANLPALRCLGSHNEDGDSIIYCGGITGRANVIELLHLLPLLLKPHGIALVILSSMNDLQRQINTAVDIFGKGNVELVRGEVTPIRDELYAGLANIGYLGEVSYVSFLKRMETIDPPAKCNGFQATNGYVRGKANEMLQVIKITNEGK